jgi:superfamily II DNA helicase RecQ
MLSRVITLRFSGVLDGFDDAPLCEFIKDKEVISLRDHFFVRNESPYLAVVVTYAVKLPPPKAPSSAQPSGGKGKRDESWRHLVAEADVPLFNSLRDWRSERAKREGFPPYIICDNRQLAAIIVARPQTLAQLGEIEGIGRGKLESYGQEILALLASKPSQPPPASPSPPESIPPSNPHNEVNSV